MSHLILNLVTACDYVAIALLIRWCAVPLLRNLRVLPSRYAELCFVVGNFILWCGLHHLCLDLERFGVPVAGAFHAWIVMPLMALFSTWALVRIWQWRHFIREDLSRVATLAAQRQKREGRR